MRAILEAAKRFPDYHFIIKIDAHDQVIVANLVFTNKLKLRVLRNSRKEPIMCS